MKQSIDKMSLGDRMKNYYEDIFRFYLPKRLPVIIRLDGRSFHSLTKNLEKPFDINFINAMLYTTKYLCENIQNVVFAYTQSDEISLLLHNYKKLNTESWFGNNIQKMVSISAGLASSFFSLEFTNDFDDSIVFTPIQFDSRVFVLPENEVCNYFIWRQMDWERNSIQMLGQTLFSHKELHLKNNSQVQEMCFEKGKNWNDLDIYLKRGTCFYKSERDWIIDKKCPIFTQDRNYIEKHLEIEED